MKKIISVCCIGDQAAPNLLFLGQLERMKFTDHLFISTNEMKKKKRDEHLKEACGENVAVSIVYVEADDLFDTISVVNNFIAEKKLLDAEFHVNLTGGTKMMSLGTWEVFKNRQSFFYYKPFSGNKIQKIDPDNLNFGKSEFEAIDYMIPLEVYCSSYGIKIERVGEPLKSFEDNRLFFSKFVKDNHELSEDDFSFLRSIKKTGIKTPTLVSYTKELGWADDQNISSKQAKYLTGGWLEEYVYGKLKLAGNLNEDLISLSLVVNVEGLSNEFDVVFMRNNKLCIIECKVAVNKVEIQNAFHKLSNLSTKFGSNIALYLIIAKTEASNIPHLKEQADKFKVEILIAEEIEAHDFFSPKKN